MQVNIYCKDCYNGTEFIYVDSRNNAYIQWQPTDSTHVNAPAYDVFTANKELNRLRKESKKSKLTKFIYYIKPVKEKLCE